MLQRIHSLHGVDGSRSGVSDDDCACVVAGGIACCSLWNDVTALAAAREVEQLSSMQKEVLTNFRE
jgi:hypothetical protein